MGGEQSQQIDDAVNDESFESNRTRAINRMDQVIRSRLRSGVQYNMKIILRGERGSGKTSLFKRFQGLSFTESPTIEIQSATINWTFRNNEDNVKVEVWDVVDKAIKNNIRSKQELALNFGRNIVDMLDATVVDVYKDTQAVIFLVNPTSQQSLEYVREKIGEVPRNISVLLVLCFRDLVGTQNACVTMSDLSLLCHKLRESRRHSDYDKRCLPFEESEQFGVFCLEISLLNCYGLQLLHKYLDIPFLKLKRAALESQLQSAMNEIKEAALELESALGKTTRYDEFETKYLARKNCGIHGDHVPSKEELSDTPCFDGDELKDSLNTLRKENISVANSSKTIALKLDHRQRETNETDAIRHSNTEIPSHHFNKPTPSRGSHCDSEMERFMPTESDNVATLEGFLEPSDEDEKKLQFSKQQIRKYLRNGKDCVPKGGASSSGVMSEVSDDESQGWKKQSPIRMTGISSRRGKESLSGESLAAESVATSISTRQISKSSLKKVTKRKTDAVLSSSTSMFPPEMDF